MKTLLLHQKIIDGKKYGELSKDSALSLCHAIKLYRNKLKSKGVPVPLNFRVKANSNRDIFLISVAEDSFPVNLSDKISICSPVEYRKLIKSTLLILDKLITNKKSDVGIDPKPENFGLKNSKIYYYDFVPPLVKDINAVKFLKRVDETSQDEKWKLKRYFTPKGILQTFFLRFLPHRLELRDILTSEITSQIDNYPDKFRKPLLNTKFYQMMKIDPKNVDSEILRCLINIVNNVGKEDRDLLRVIYLLTFYNKKSSIKNKDIIFNFYKLYKLPENFKAMKSFLTGELIRVFNGREN